MHLYIKRANGKIVCVSPFMYSQSKRRSPIHSRTNFNLSDYPFLNSKLFIYKHQILTFNNLLFAIN